MDDGSRIAGNAGRDVGDVSRPTVSCAGPVPASRFTAVRINGRCRSTRPQAALASDSVALGVAVVAVRAQRLSGARVVRGVRGRVSRRPPVHAPLPLPPGAAAAGPDAAGPLRGVDQPNKWRGQRGEYHRVLTYVGGDALVADRGAGPDQVPVLGALPAHATLTDSRRLPHRMNVTRPPSSPRSTSFAPPRCWCPRPIDQPRRRIGVVHIPTLAACSPRRAGPATTSGHDLGLHPRGESGFEIHACSPLNGNAVCPLCSTRDTRATDVGGRSKCPLNRSFSQTATSW